MIRLECIFEAGNWYEKVFPVHPFLRLKCLPKEPTNHTSAEISEAFDKIGAFIEMTHTSDRIGIAFIVCPDFFRRFYRW